MLLGGSGGAMLHIVGAVTAATTVDRRKNYEEEVKNKSFAPATKPLPRARRAWLLLNEEG